VSVVIVDVKQQKPFVGCWRRWIRWMLFIDWRCYSDRLPN